NRAGRLCRVRKSRAIFTEAETTRPRMSLTAPSATFCQNWVSTLIDAQRRPMRHQPTTGTHHDDTLDLLTQLHHISQARRASLRRTRLGLDKQVVVTLILLRQNISQMTAADIFGISQPTISRIYRRTLPLLGRVLQFTGISLEE